MSLSSQNERLRDLARYVVEISHLPIQQERIQLWKEFSRGKPRRPLVLVNPQRGWEELVPDSACQCADPRLRDLEKHLRMTIFRHEHIPDDMPILNELTVFMDIRQSDFGVREVMHQNDPLGAYHWDPPIKTRQDLEKLKFPTLHIDRKTSEEKYQRISEILGDIMEVRLKGICRCRCGLTRQLIMLRGLDQMMLDMYEQPELLHELMAFLRDAMIHEFDHYERENVLALNSGPAYVCGSGTVVYSDELPSKDHSGTVRTCDTVCWGESQETVGVGPVQFEEFVLQYQLPIFKRFGLVDYGCCEPLDAKFDLLINHIPNLRWVSVSPWCNRTIAAEKLGTRFGYVYKPNPAPLCVPHPNFDAAERDIRQTLEMARGCRVVVVMKDTHTFCNDPSRIERWTTLAQRMAHGSR